MSSTLYSLSRYHCTHCSVILHVQIQHVHISKQIQATDAVNVAVYTISPQMEEEEEEDEIDGVIVERTDMNRAATLYLQKLQNLMEYFESKNEDYQTMEKKFEKLRKVRGLLDSVGV